MSAHTNQLFAHAAKVKAARETESVDTAQAALDKALARYDAMPSISHAYNIAAAKDRVAAAQAREMVAAETQEPVAPRLMCLELRTEWKAAGGI